MTPQEYNNNKTAVDQYKYNLLSAYTDYCVFVCDEVRTSLNTKYTEQLLLNLVLLRLFNRSIVEYLTVTMANDTNSMTYSEILQIVRHTNRIMNTNYELTLTL